MDSSRYRLAHSVVGRVHIKSMHVERQGGGGGGGGTIFFLHTNARAQHLPFITNFQAPKIKKKSWYPPLC